MTDRERKAAAGTSPAASPRAAWVCLTCGVVFVLEGPGSVCYCSPACLELAWQLADAARDADGGRR